MSLPNVPTYSGGCQCGAIRFAVEGALGQASICHCRMCQKAFGAFFAPLVSVRGARLVWTRGAPKTFASSDLVRRGICSLCGTPLTFEAPDGLALAIGAFDDPSTIAPSVQWGVEAKLPYVDGLTRLPAHATMDDVDAQHYLARLVSRQHPDHDTPSWPPERAQDGTHDLPQDRS